MTKSILVAAALIMATTAFAAPTLQEKYEKLWQKALKGDLENPKLACLCRDSAELGVMRRTSTPFPGAVCAVPTFNPDGSLSSASSCSDFVIFPK